MIYIIDYRVTKDGLAAILSDIEQKGGEIIAVYPWAPEGDISAFKCSTRVIWRDK